MSRILATGKNILIHPIVNGVEYTGYPLTRADLVTYDNTTGQTVDEAIAAIKSSIGAASGIAPLNSSSKIDATYLPSYVDDVIEGTMSSDLTTFTATSDADGSSVTYNSSNAEAGKVYVDTTSNKTYRWGGTKFVTIASDLALGETSTTAYYGDKGKTAYTHSQVTSGNPHKVTKSDVGLGSVENKSSETIRGEITSDNIETALGYTPVALGETSTTAYYGDKGKTAYTHSQITSGNPHNVTKSDVGLGSVENKSSETIRGELTSANVIAALGYTPVDGASFVYVQATQPTATNCIWFETVE